MARCFVIQPFDKGDFDTRYNDVIKPAIEAEDLEPYRVDNDPAVTIPVDHIESEIRDSALCLADITNDNPNVWFELGYALSANKEVVLICSAARDKYPFDVQHRSIVKYRTGSKSHFEQLERDIRARVAAIMKSQGSVEKVAKEAMIKPVAGLDPSETTTMATIAEYLTEGSDYVPGRVIARSMERVGFTAVATSISLKMLERKNLISVETGSDEDGDFFFSYKIEPQGWDWIIENKERFVLVTKPKSDFGQSQPGGYSKDFDDDIPF